MWCTREEALYWVDIRRPALRRWRPRANEVTTWAMPELVGSFAFRDGGGLLLAMQGRLALFDPMAGTFDYRAAPESHRPGHRFNDGKCDRQGRFWSGTMHTDDRTPVGSLYRVTADGSCTAMLSGICIPNSLCWSVDGRTMYFTDSLSHMIFAYAYDPATGTLGEKRPFAKVEAPGIPDGATVDSEDHVWSAEYGNGRVTRFAPDGSVVRRVDLPASQPTCCAFGGKDLATLFVTTATQNLTAEKLAQEPLAGALLAIDVGVRGVAEARFPG